MHKFSTSKRGKLKCLKAHENVVTSLKFLLGPFLCGAQTLNARYSM